MEVFFGILFSLVYVIGIPAMLIVLLVRTSEMKKDFDEIKNLLSDKPHENAEEEAVEPAPPVPVPKPSIAPYRDRASVSAPPALPKPPASPEPVPGKPVIDLPPTAMDLFWQKVVDWLAVKGEFAPKGVTHEFAFATRWLVRIGVLLVAASLVYFVKLSIDRGWMGPTGRVASTIFWGAVASVVGVFLVKRTRNYGIIGHAVASLGVLALYVGFGLGHRYFDPPVIASAPFAFAALFAVTLYAGFAAIFMPSAFIAVMAVVGGYAVPVLAGRDTGSPLGLCAYLLVIDIMAFLVARFRRWSALDFLSATIAYATLFVWCGSHPRLAGGPALVVFAAFTAIHAIYMLGVVRDSGRRGNAGNAIAWAGLALNACAYLAYLSTHFRAGFSSELTGLVFLALVAAYLGVAVWAKNAGRADRATVGIVLVFAMAFLSIAPILLFGNVWWTFAWAAIAVAASEAGAHLRERLLANLSFIVFAAAAIYGVFHLAPLFYGKALGIAGCAAGCDAGCGGGYWRALVQRSVRLWSLPVAAALIARRSRGGVMLWIAYSAGFLLYTIESYLFGMEFMPALKGGSITLAWVILAFAGVWTGIVRRIRPLRIFALSLLGVSALKLLLFDTSHLPVPARVAVFAIVGSLMIVGAFLYLKFKERFTENDES